MTAEIPVMLLKSVLTLLTPSVINQLKEKWNEEKAFRYAKDRLRLKYELKIKPIDYDEITLILKITRKDIVNIPTNKESFDIISFLREVSLLKTSDLIYDKNEKVLNEFIDEFIDITLEYYLTTKISIKNKIIIDLLFQIIDKQNKHTQYLVPLHELLTDQSDYSEFKNQLVNDLLFFIEEDYIVMEGIQKILLKKNGKQKPILISGAPETGKTYLSLFLAYKLMKERYYTYYIRLDKPSLDITRMFDELFNLSKNSLSQKTLIIFDNCHDRIDIFNDLAKTYRRFQNFNFLFISRDLLKSDIVDNYSDFDLLEFIEEHHFKVSNNKFNEKAIGIIHKYKQYKETKDNKSFGIGKIQYVVNNAHQSLVSLHFNLQMWRQDLPLDQVDKHKVFEKLFKRYLHNDIELSFMLIIASLYKYEIYLDASGKFLETAVTLSKKGIITKEERSNYYYLYHSSFAKLLLNAYSVHSEFRKYRNQDDLVYNKIREYILSFENYPLNFDNIFYYLNSNHGLDIGRNLLKDENIISRFIEFHRKNKMNVELYLFLLYRLDKKDNKITDRLCKEISNDTWKDNLMELSFPRFSLSLFRLDRSNPDKASSILNSLKLSDLVQKIKSSELKFHLLTNSIREIVRISGRNNLGIQLLNSLSIDYLVTKIKSTNLIHLGKTISELHATSPKIAEEVIKKIEPDFISRLIKDSDLKSYSKSLNEIKKTHPQLSNIFLNFTPDETLIDQLVNSDLRLEGVSRSLTELSKIDPSKAKRLFYNLPTDKLLILIYDSSIIQIAQSLSELLSIDKKDEIHKKNISKMFLELDEIKLSRKINTKSAKFHSIGNALSLLTIFDVHKNKIKHILEKIDKLNLLSKATKCTFHEFCLGLTGIHFSNDNLSTYLLNNLNGNSLLRKANGSELDFIGSDLYKLSKINKSLSDDLLKKINWEKIIRRGENVRFTKLVDSVTALSNYNKIFAKQLLQKIIKIFGSIFFIKRASYVNRNALLDSLNKLNTVDKIIVRDIVLALKKNNLI